LRREKPSRCRFPLHAWIVGALLVAAADADASYGFFDQGLVQTPVVRTDYSSADAGTAVAPLAISDCHFGQNPCPLLHSVFSQSNYWSLNWPEGCQPGSCPNYWLLTNNDENADSLSNSGPPDASLPHAWPGNGIMGFNVLYGDDNFPGDTYWRAHLVLNFWFTDPQFAGNPFLGFGAFSSHGNGGNLGSLNPSPPGVPSVLEFDARLWGKNLPTPVYEFQQSTIVFWVQVFANWGAHPKAIQIALFHEASGDYLGSSIPATTPWEWRYVDSVYYPGAIFTSTRAEDLTSYCSMRVPRLALQQDVHYSIDLQKLFRCFSDHGLFTDGLGNNDPLPATANIPITAVNWADEGTGVKGDIWVDVHNIRMTDVADGIFAAGFD
jgi:hypothetical protein